MNTRIKEQLELLSRRSVLFALLVLSLVVSNTLAYHLNAMLISVACVVGVIIAELLPWIVQVLWKVVSYLTGMKLTLDTKRYFTPNLNHEESKGSTLIRAVGESRRLLSRMFFVVLPIANVAHEECDKESRDLYVPALLGQPIYYVSWYNMGVLVATIVGAPVAYFELPLELCVPLAFYIFLRSLADVLNEGGRAASKSIRDSISAALTERIESIKQFGGLNDDESVAKKSQLLGFVTDNATRLGYFYTNWVSLLEQVYRASITMVVMIYISPLPGLVALGALLLCLIIIVHDLLTSAKDRRQYAILLKRRESLRILESNPRLRLMYQAFANPNLLAEQIDAVTREIDDHETQVRWEAKLRRGVTLVIFISLTAVGASIPMLAAYNEQLSLRVALLYLFSMMGSWLACYQISRRMYDVSDGYALMADDLELLGTSLSYGEQGQGPEVEEEENPFEHSRIEIEDGTTVAAPFFGPIVRCRGMNVPPTVGDAEVVKVVAERGGLGTSTLLQMLTGYRKTLSGSVKVGGRRLDEVVRSSESRQLLYFPDTLGPYERCTIAERFAHICGTKKYDSENPVSGIYRQLSEEEFLTQVKKALNLFKKGHLDPELLYLPHGETFLREEDTKVLWLAACFASLAAKREDKNGFRAHVKVVAIDGIHLISENKELRDHIVVLFKHLCSKLGATLIVTICRGDHIEDGDYVISVNSPRTAFADDRKRDSDLNVAALRPHSQWWSSVNESRQNWYRKHIKPARGD